MAHPNFTKALSAIGFLWDLGCKLLARLTTPFYSAFFGKDAGLRWAVGLGDRVQTQAQLKAGANVNTPDEANYTPLHLAARAGRADVVALLVRQRGVDINAIANQGRASYEQYAETPLNLAAMAGHFDVVKALSQEPGIRYCDFPHSNPAELAARAGYPAIAELLIAKQKREHPEPLPPTQFPQGPAAPGCAYIRPNAATAAAALESTSVANPHRPS
jgi:hypothetical protein